MSFWSAFARGVAGPGAVDLSRKMDARDADAARAAAADEERAFRAAEAEKDRQARAAAAGSRGSRSGGGGGADAADDGSAAVYGLMRDMSMSESDAMAAVQASKRGENIFTQAGQATDMIDDGDRQRAVTRTTSTPDLKRYAEVNRKIGEYLLRGPSIARSNDAQLADGERTRWGTAAGQAAEESSDAAPSLNRGQQVAQGKYDPEGDAAKREAAEALAEQRRREKTDYGGRRLDLQELESERKRLKDSVTVAAKALETATRESRVARQTTYDRALADLEAFNRANSSAPPPAAPPAAPPPGPGASGITVTAPNGQVLTFPSQKAADDFKKAAGIR